MTKDQKIWKASLLAAGTSLFALGLSLPAMAQETVDTTEDEESVQERVIITGSRIATDSTTTAASPVLSIGADELETSGETDIAFLLRETPALNASLPGSFSAFNAADTEDSDLGVGLLNLRNLGIERTLVLQNGRRHVSGTAGQAAVDTNTIPVSLLDRVEVLTGGASSVYGADAVSGVVNFILRDGASFDGLEYRLQGGVTSRGDAEELFASIANGFDFDNGRGDAVVSLEYSRTDAVFASDRTFAGRGIQSLVENSAAVSAAFGRDPNAANVFVPDFTIPISSNLGIIAIGDGGASAFGGVADLVFGGPQFIGTSMVPGVQVFDAGFLRPFDPGVVANLFEASGGDGISATPDIELILPDSERVVFNALTRYEIVPGHNFFLEGKYAYSDTRDSIQVNGFNDDIPIALDNPFIPAALRDQLDSLIAEGIDPVIAVSRDVIDEAVVPLPRAERETFRFVGGLQGELPFNTNYELSYNYGRTNVTVTNGNTRIEDRFFAAIDAVIDPATGQAVCRSTLQSNNGDTVTNPPLSPFPQFREGFFTFQPGDGQCQPINILGANTIAGPGADFAFIDTIDRTVLTQEVILGTLNGDTEDFFSLPGGAIGWAAGLEYRKDTTDFMPDPLDTTGLTAGFRTPTQPAGGTDEVLDFFLEGKAPLLANLPLAELVEVSGSVRFSDYRSIGNTTTWSVGGRYSPHEWLTVRGTYSEAIRAPNLGELFSPQQPATLGATADPCNANFLDAGSEFRAQNCAMLVPAGFNSANFNSAFVPGVSGGNPNLNAEEAETFTVGFVFEPQGPLTGFRLIADYYDIQIAGAIDDLTGFQIASNCVDLPTLDNVFCEQITRDPVNANITFFESGQINLGAFETKGVDFSAVYDFDLDSLINAAAGNLRLSATGTRFIEFDETPDAAEPDAIIDRLGTFADPEWIVNFAADYSIANWNIGWRGRYESSQLLPGITNEDIISNPDFADPFASGSAFVHDFTTQYDFSEKFQIYGGVNNAFDRDPFIGTLSRPAGPRGRFFFVGIQGNF